MILLGLLGCPKPPEAPPPALEATPREAPAPVVPTGKLEGRTWVDARGFTLEAPDGWTVQAGNEPGALRVALVDPETHVRVEVWAFTEGPLRPRPREGCAWTFEDRARYRAVKVTGDVLAATCTPDVPGGPRVLGYYVAREGVAWHLEAVVPAGELHDGKQAADGVFGTFRLR
ncbi:MAG: hypothetical protein ACOZNI_35930 [Myxococcota bacterium]